MSQPLRQTKRLLERIIAVRQISEDASVTLFVALRRLIEKEGRQKSFPTLWFYCNWCMHPEIDRGLTKDWLTRISKAIGETPPSVWYTDQVAFIMSLDKLREELIKLFEHYKLNPFLFDSLTNWQALLRRLFEHLIDTPLQRSDHIPPDSAHRFWITKLQITLENPGGQQPNPNGCQPSKFRLVMDFRHDDVNGLYPNTPDQGNGNKCQIFMPVVIPEKPEAFKFP